MAAATAVVTNQGLKQFGGMYSEMWGVKATLDAASAAAGAGATDTVTVPGVALGDHVISFGFGVSETNGSRRAFVSAANTVTIAFTNNTGTVDLASTTIKLVIGRPAF